MFLSSKPWRYCGVDLQSAATKSDSRLLTLDWNGDGFEDVVVWTRAAQSRRTGEPDPAFQVTEETLAVSLFDSEKQAFGPPLTAAPPAPDPLLWERLPAVGWTAIP